MWIISLLGACITALGVYVQVTGESALQQMVAGTLAAFGAGVVGAAFSLYFGAEEGRNAMIGDIRSLFQETFAPDLRSKEDDLAVVRDKWYYYYLTERKGRSVWRHVFLDFSLKEPNVIKVDTIDGGRTYRMEVAVRGSRVLFVDTALDKRDPPLVGFAADLHEEWSGAQAGVLLLKSFDGNNLLTKCLWSRVAIVDVNGDHGAVDIDDQLAEELDRLWNASLHFKNNLGPATVTASAVPPLPLAIEERERD